MKIAVVGAGIFGTTIAARLSSENPEYYVTLCDTAYDILTAASRTNQLRLHRGYHYPRAPDTVSSLLSSLASFASEYQPAILSNFDHFYCIANEQSFVSAEEYTKFCDEFGLEYLPVTNFQHVANDRIALTLQVKENLLDYKKLYDLCWQRIRQSRIHTSFGTDFTKADASEFDIVINCTYARLNDIVDDNKKQNYQFEVCEKIIVKMPESISKKSIVVMDGPFMCVDPYGTTGLSLLGNVVHAIHHTNVGHSAEVPPDMVKDLNVGFVKNPQRSNFQKIKESGECYIPALSKAEYVASMFTVRTVLPDVDATDKRPTLVEFDGDKMINVFSGKIDTCVESSKAVARILSEVVV